VRQLQGGKRERQAKKQLLYIHASGSWHADMYFQQRGSALVMVAARFRFLPPMPRRAAAAARYAIRYTLFFLPALPLLLPHELSPDFFFFSGFSARRCLLLAIHTARDALSVVIARAMIER